MWTDSSTFIVDVVRAAADPPPLGITQVEVIADVRNAQGSPSGAIAPAFLRGSFGSAAPLHLVRFEVLDPDNADVIYSDGDQLRLVFDVPTDRGRSEGGKLFVDNLLEFSVQLGTSYSGAWSDESTLTITSVATHPNFLGYDEDATVALANARCRWGDEQGSETVPTVLEAMTVQCPSYLSPTAGARTLQLSLNNEDYLPLEPLYTYYEEPRLATFVHSLYPEGGLREGGTLVTLHGDGFNVMPAAGTTFVRCRWGSIYDGNDTVALYVNATEIICPSAPLAEGLQNLSIALNGQQFFATNLQLLVYPQPGDFSQVALNTSDLGLGPPKYFGTLVGAPVGEIAFVWLRGRGFNAFQNSSTSVSERLLRCLWGNPLPAAHTASDAGTDSIEAPSVTMPTRVEDDLVVCPAAIGSVAGDVGLHISLNGLDYINTGFSMRYYVQPTRFSRSLNPADTVHCATRFDAACVTGMYPTGGVSLGGTSVTIFGEGFGAFRLQPELSSCQWGDAISIPTTIGDNLLICPTPSQVEASVSAPATSSVPFRVALNGVHFADTGHRFLFYQQPVNFSSVTPTGGIVSGGTAVTIRGEGFLAFSNSSAMVRCKWGLDTNGTTLDNSTDHETVAVELGADRIVCPAHPKANPGSREVFLSLNSVDFGGTGVRIWSLSPLCLGLHCHFQSSP